VRRRILLILALAATTAAACGDQPLANVGDLSRDFVHGGSTTTTTTLPDEGDGDRPVGLIASTDLMWENDTLANQATGDPNVVVSSVWARGNGIEAFIQASRAEIAAALPEARFPELVPDSVGWVTSQLVFDVASATLDAGTAAAFGLWALEPYTVTRTEGQLAVFRIGAAAPEEAGAPDEPIRAEVAEQGLSLTWREGAYRYELFCRANLDEDACWQMAESVAPLSILVPEPAPSA
jgi:hypothetical protein